jgi:hypothetical protein
MAETEMTLQQHDKAKSQGEKLLIILVFVDKFLPDDFF